MNSLYYLPWIPALLIMLSTMIAVYSLSKPKIFTLAKYLYYAAAGIVALMLICLLMAFVTCKFQYSYVYHYSSVDLPVLYRIAGVWAGQEGSITLWTFFIMIAGIIAVNREEQLRQGFLTIVGLVSLIFVIHCINNNPFAYIWDTSKNFPVNIIPTDGAGLNPLLQDFWMIIHPPVLFIGYALSTIAFIYAILSLLYNNYSIILTAYRYVLATVLALGAGIFLGGYWAYKVLGWGGYWGWDPVENASLIPWLISIALLHGLILQKRKQVLVRANIAMAIGVYVFVLFGTFLTRSGVLSDFSVHSFSGAGNFTDLLLFLSTIVVLSIGLIIYRYRDACGKVLENNLLSKENIMVYGIAAMLFFALFVTIGTCMPLLTRLLSQPSTVRESYYISIVKPVGFVIVVLLLLATFTKKLPLKIRTFVIPITIASGLTILLYIGQTIHIFPLILMFVSFFIIAVNIKSLFPYTHLNRAARIAHSGVALLVIGIITSQTQSLEYHTELIQKEKKTIYPITLELVGMTGGAKNALVFHYSYYNKDKTITTPYFIDTRTNQLFREPSIDYNILYDAYISPGEYMSGYDKLTQVMLKKGEINTLGDITIRFDSFDVDRVAMMKGNAIVYAQCTITYKGTQYTVKPGVAYNNDMRQDIKAMIPGTNRTVVLLDFDVRDGIVVLHIDANENAVLPPDSVIVDISFKRLIWLVWLGTVIIVAGVALPLARRS
ncbi:MAG: cytochrome c biogenesis protein CcsA [Spirochaetes bacterium]|nr:cytochrome c biogenesis protein CcsA [Spirochaetota bacterium]